MTDKPKDKSKQTLRSLTDEEQTLMWDIDDYLNPEVDEHGEIADDESNAVKLIQLQLVIETKADRMLNVVEELEHQAALARADYDSKKKIIERSSAACKRAESNIKQIKRMIKEHMEGTQKTEMLLPSGRGFKICNNGGKFGVHVPKFCDYSKWPEHLVKVVYSENGDAIRDADKAGEELPEGVYVKQGTNLKII